MFDKDLSLDVLNAMSKETMVAWLGIEYTEIGDDFLKARMPVDHRTHQPLKMLHGGASVALAETLGSVASNVLIDRSKQYCVGLEINANHIRSISRGYVYGTAKPMHLGRKTHVWDIRITDEQENLISVSRLTMAVLDHR